MGCNVTGFCLVRHTLALAFCKKVPKYFPQPGETAENSWNGYSSQQLSTPGKLSLRILVKVFPEYLCGINISYDKSAHYCHISFSIIQPCAYEMDHNQVQSKLFDSK